MQRPAVLLLAACLSAAAQSKPGFDDVAAMVRSAEGNSSAALATAFGEDNLKTGRAVLTRSLTSLNFAVSPLSRE